MREFRSKWSRQQAASEAKRSDGLTEEQHKAMMAEFDRRIAAHRHAPVACGRGVELLPATPHAWRAGRRKE